MEDFKLKWVLLKTITLLKNTFIKVERRIYANHFSKGIEDYSIVTFSQNGTVAIVALDKELQEKENKKSVVLVRQYRPAADRWIVNLPGGRIDNEQTAEEAVKKELEEETGYIAEDLERICETYSNPTRITDRAVILLSRRAKKEKDPKPNSTEKGLEVITANLDDIIKLLLGEAGEVEFKFVWPKDLLGEKNYFKRGDICDSTTIAALMLVSKRS